MDNGDQASKFSINWNQTIINAIENYYDCLLGQMLPNKLFLKKLKDILKYFSENYRIIKYHQSDDKMLELMNQTVERIRKKSKFDNDDLRLAIKIYLFLEKVINEQKQPLAIFEQLKIKLIKLLNELELHYKKRITEHLNDVNDILKRNNTNLPKLNSHIEQVFLINRIIKSKKLNSFTIIEIVKSENEIRKLDEYMVMEMLL